MQRSLLMLLLSGNSQSRFFLFIAVFFAISYSHVYVLQPQHQWMENDDITRFLGCSKVRARLINGNTPSVSCTDSKDEEK